MKKLVLFFTGLCMVAFTALGQDPDSEISGDQEENFEVTESDEVDIVTEEVVKKSNADTTKLKLGDKEVEVVEKDGETTLKIKDLNKNDFDDDMDDDDWDWDWDFSDDDGPAGGKFKGHWAGIEFGLNSYLNKDMSFSLGESEEYLELNTGKSWNINLNFAQYSFPVIKDRFGLVTGMGLEWSNYHFANDYSIQKVDGAIDSLPLNLDLIKNRLQTTYLTVPLLMETQIFSGSRKDRLYISAGVIGGVKLFSNTKYKYYEDGKKEKKKVRNDFYLRPLRYGVTARVGYKSLKLYCNYYLSSLFMEDKGPELYPVAMGLSVTF